MNRYRIVHAGKTLATLKAYSPHAIIKAYSDKYPIKFTIWDIEVKTKHGWKKVVS